MFRYWNGVLIFLLIILFDDEMVLFRACKGVQVRV